MNILKILIPLFLLTSCATTPVNEPISIPYKTELEFKNECTQKDFYQCIKWICFNGNVTKQRHVSEIYSKFIDHNENISLLYHDYKLLKGKVLQSNELFLFILDNGIIFELENTKNDISKATFTKQNDSFFIDNINDPLMCYKTFSSKIINNPFNNIK